MPTNSNENISASVVLSSSLKRKEDGNRLFAKQKYKFAVACYRVGLEELTSYNTANSEEEGGENGESNCNDDIINTEVSLRSNIALALQKQAEEESKQCTNAEMEKFYIEIEEQCTIALQLDPANAKLFHRRGIARQYLAEQQQHRNNNRDNGSDERWNEAEEDLKKAIEILESKETLDKKEQKQVADARNTLEILQVRKAKSQTSDNKEESSITSSMQSNGHTQSMVLQSDCSSERGLPPSPQIQRDSIFKLLQRCDPPVGVLDREGYFLVSMEWWQSWCRYVGLFSMYTIGIDKNDSTPQEIKQHCQQIDASNREILELLPTGATFPSYLEQDRNDLLCEKKGDSKNNDASDSSSSSSEDEDDVDDRPSAAIKMSPRPGVIDNSSLVLPPNKEGWSCAIEALHYKQQNKVEKQDGKDDEETPILLRNHLVRGHHYELLPREAYATLRSWYGESTTPILRRLTIDAEAPSSTPHVHLYSEHWDVISQRSSSLSSSKTSSFICSACGSPEATSKCKKCGVSRYCNRSCQVAHWSFHRKVCPTLKKQQEKCAADGNNGNSLKSQSECGRVGLNNLGNTCFLNSAVQCMVHVAPLTRYFLSGRFNEDINTHNILGTGGKVAHAYSSALKDLCMGCHQYQNVSPTELKRAIQLFAPQFSGASQQDAAEFITYLLDALHEDLNRIKKPPYVEMPDVDLGRKLSISGAEAWKLSGLRNDSFVYDNFYGLYKSKCVCPVCNKVTIKFDPFNHITLEIPQQSLRHIAITLIRDCAETGPELPTKYCISIPNTATIYNVKEKLCQISGMPLARLLLCGFDSSRNVLKELFDNDKRQLSSIPHDAIINAYEIVSLEDKNHIHCCLNQFAVDSNLVDVGGVNRHPIGIPILFSLHASFSCAKMYNKILMYVMPFTKMDLSSSTAIEALRSRLRVKVHFLEDGRQPELILPDSNDTLLDIIGQGGMNTINLLDLEWVDTVHFGQQESSNTQIHYSNFTSTKCHSSYLEQEKKLGSSDPTSVSLYECFDSFTQPERLDDENMLYCSGCKEHVQAMKTVTFWRLPKIMVVHLKRFEYRSAFNRSKISVLVDFPLDGLDLDSHSPQNTVPDEFVDDRVPMIYDLFGVVNHYGRMGYGHYTAHARRWDEHGVEQKWAEFDDENVTSVTNANSIVSPAAYVLYYKRRLFL